MCRDTKKVGNHCSKVIKRSDLQEPRQKGIRRRSITIDNQVNRHELVSTGLSKEHFYQN